MKTNKHIMPINSESLTPAGLEALIISTEEKAGIERKAEIKMKETMGTKKTGKRFITLTAAAALALTCAATAGAYAYRELIHKDSVEMYLEGAEALENQGLAQNRIMENGHVRITLDSLLSDGYQAMAVVTVEALDDYGLNYTQNTPSFRLRYTDTGDAFFNTGGGGMDDWEEQTATDTVKYYQTIDLANIDVDRPLEMIFFSFDEWEGKTENKLNSDLIPEDNSLGYDFITPVDLRKNVDTVELTAADGSRARLSQFELVTRGTGYWDSISETNGFKLIRADGSYESFWSGLSGSSISDDNEGEPRESFLFGKFIDLEDYSGAEINGIKFTKDE